MIPYVAPTVSSDVENDPQGEIMAKLATAPADVIKDVPTGPSVGESLPDFELRDQFGNFVRYSKTRGERKALVLFHRSASW